jgi:hypothetical protein
MDWLLITAWIYSNKCVALTSSIDWGSVNMLSIRFLWANYFLGLIGLKAPQQIVKFFLQEWVLFNNGRFVIYLILRNQPLYDHHKFLFVWLCFLQIFLKVRYFFVDEFQALVVIVWWCMPGLLIVQCENLLFTIFWSLKGIVIWQTGQISSNLFYLSINIYVKLLYALNELVKRCFHLFLDCVNDRI